MEHFRAIILGDQKRGSLYFVLLCGIKGHTNLISFQEEICSVDCADPSGRLESASECLADDWCVLLLKTEKR